jgi:hypothetical protein
MLSKEIIANIKELSIEDRVSLDAFRQACNYTSNVFEEIVRSQPWGGIQAYHEALLIGLETAIDRINKNTYVAEELKRAQVHYLTMLKTKMEKAKDLMVLL